MSKSHQLAIEDITLGPLTVTIAASHAKRSKELRLNVIPAGPVTYQVFHNRVAVWETPHLDSAIKQYNSFDETRTGP